MNEFQNEAGLDFAWQASSDGRELIELLKQPLGLLEKPQPLQSSTYQSIEHKLLFHGRPNVGKSSFISSLFNVQLNETYCETPGIQISTIYWPVKRIQTGSILIVKLNLWDIGENSLIKYDHFACRENLDGMVFVFSFTDKESFLDATRKVSSNDGIANKFIVGSKFGCDDAEVTLSDILEFESSRRIKVYMSPSSPNLQDSADFLNGVCSKLILNKQSIIEVKKKFELE